MKRAIYQISAEIRADWRTINPAAKEYLNAMSCLENVGDYYGFDSGREILCRFLANAGTWKGETAKRIKSEIKQLMK